MRRLAAVVLALLPACRSRNETNADASASSSLTAERGGDCPSEVFLEDLHAAAFHFQHGAGERARTHLEQARAVVPSPTDPTSLTIMAQLSAVSLRLDSDPAWAASETEHVRIAFGSWRCLPEDLHRRMHTRLPPLR